MTESAVLSVCRVEINHGKNTYYEMRKTIYLFMRQGAKGKSRKVPGSPNPFGSIPPPAGHLLGLLLNDFPTAPQFSNSAIRGGWPFF